MLKLEPNHCLRAMSEEQLKAFLEKVKGDAALQEKLKAAKSPEEAIAIAKEARFTITTEDIQNGESEMSDDELEQAAGGDCGPTTWYCYQSA